MCDWALAADYGSMSPGFNAPLTLAIYGVGPDDSVGSLLASQTVDAFIPWRPPSGGCPGPTAWRAKEGNCYHGLAPTPPSVGGNPLAGAARGRGPERYSLSTSSLRMSSSRNIPSVRKA
jgi:hypothetical protein